MPSYLRDLISKVKEKKGVQEEEPVSEEKKQESPAESGQPSTRKQSGKEDEKEKVKEELKKDLKKTGPKQETPVEKESAEGIEVLQRKEGQKLHKN